MTTQADSWNIPVTANGALVKDGYRPRDGDRMIEVVPASEVQRLQDWLHYIGETTGDDNVRASVELAQKGEAVEWDDA